MKKFFLAAVLVVSAVSTSNAKVAECTWSGTSWITVGGNCYVLDQYVCDNSVEYISNVFAGNCGSGYYPE